MKDLLWVLTLTPMCVRNVYSVLCRVLQKKSEHFESYVLAVSTTPLYNRCKFCIGIKNINFGFAVHQVKILVFDNYQRCPVPLSTSQEFLNNRNTGTIIKSRNTKNTFSRKPTLNPWLFRGSVGAESEHLIDDLKVADGLQSDLLADALYRRKAQHQIPGLASVFGFHFGHEGKEGVLYGLLVGADLLPVLKHRCI